MSCDNVKQHSKPMIKITPLLIMLLQDYTAGLHSVSVFETLHSTGQRTMIVLHLETTGCEHHETIGEDSVYLSYIIIKKWDGQLNYYVKFWLNPNLPLIWGNLHEFSGWTLTSGPHFIMNSSQDTARPDSSRGTQRLKLVQKGRTGNKARILLVTQLKGAQVFKSHKNQTVPWMGSSSS